MSNKLHLLNFKCGKCGKTYKRKLGLANHINDDMSCKIPSSLKPTTKRFQCDKCELKYTLICVLSANMSYNKGICTYIFYQ